MTGNCPARSSVVMGTEAMEVCASAVTLFAPGVGPDDWFREGRTLERNWDHLRCAAC